MENTEEVAKLVKDAMESLGAKVVDVSIYPSTKLSFKFDILIAAGYVPGKACLLTVYANIYKNGIHSDIIFDIRGEYEKRFMNKMVGGVGPIFAALDRHRVGGEWYGGGTFSINHCVTIRAGSSAGASLEAGMAFFNDFLRLYGSFLMNRFTRHIRLGYAPEYSDAFLALEEKNGKYSGESYIPFNSKVLAKFPKGIFSEHQQTR